ncbi:PAS domain S-box protein [Romeria aff. gracilis LEGE 07310]|uniref:Circadian input-output histidine kinase CikA n=1 Tax=Vasconcelosia minhoensis LEGE 07310 TaxID=915328 RepID=A0A8J7AYQ6_9CYAN|nr:PAS domain S-box protein [Romeria gracilis]MBE9080328.1 PAS domain S-box protein [Romeria aff. gracilis LEGE 07310]
MRLIDPFADGGEMGERLRAHSWSHSSLGTIETWPQSLRAALRMMLRSRQPMFLWWGPSLVHFYNDGAIALLGQRHPAALGQPARTVWADLWAMMGPKVQVVMQQASTVQIEGLTAMAGGGGRSFDLTYSPVADEQGEVGGILCACREQTPHQQTETALKASLRQSESRFHTLADHISQLAWMADETGSIFWYNRRWFDYTGTTLAEMQGWGWQNVHHPDHVQRVVEHIRHCFETGEPWEDIFPLRGKDGSYRSFLSRALPIRDAQGCILRWFGTNTDITERLQIEENLRASEERFRQMAETIQDVFWITDFRIPKILYVSPAYQQIWGRSPEEIYGDHALWLETIHPDDRAQVLEVVAQCQHQDFVENEYRIVRPDGAVRWIRDRSFAVRNDQGTIVQAVGTAQDITDRKQIEAERELLLTQAEAAREQAEIANRVKDEFLAMLSHELRSPLNPILGWSKLLQTRSFTPEKTQQALATIERNARLQAQLVEDLLDISRILRGKLSLKVAPINLERTIEAALETVRLSAEAKSIQIESAFDPGIPPVLGDANRLQQVVWNLLSNAIKFTPAGGRVRLRLEQVSPYACFSVSDTGRGIKADFIPYLFESFRQADSSTTRKYGGLGLGLSIVRQLVELHGGTVRAESEGEGLGATFSVCLPLMPMALAGQAPGQPTTQLSKVHLQGIYVLVVEDEADTRNILTFMLEQAGATVAAAAAAEEGLLMLQTDEPDLLISDIAMPAMDGYGFIRRVRELNFQIPAIALTACATEAERQQILAAGFQRHLTKPVDPIALMKVVKALLKKAARE